MVLVILLVMPMLLAPGSFCSGGPELEEGPPASCG